MAIFDFSAHISPIDWPWLLTDAFLHLATFLLVCLHVLRTPREAASALLWIFIAWAIPVFGPLLYVMFGINRVERKAWHKQNADQKLLAERLAREDEALPMFYWRAVHESLAAEPADAFARQLNAALNNILPDYPLLGGNEILPLVDGDETFPRMREAIGRARHHIHLQTFIIGNDVVGREFLDLLAHKAREGVSVRFLYDRFGSTGAALGLLFAKYRRVPGLDISGWTQANLFKRQFQINLRNHRKILVIDGQEAFIGGINLQVENLSRPAAPPIRDYHFYVKGPVVQELQYSFLRDWYFMTDENPEVLLQTAHFPHLPPAGSALVRVANSGPTADEMELIADVFFEAIISARRQLLVVTPYFVPHQDILRAFRAATMRGVDVRLVMPLHNNHVYAGLAGSALYEELLTAGVRIFRRRPPFMHAKAMLVDDALAIVGSANLDVRSLRLNYETNLVVFDAPFINALKRIVLRDIAESDELTLAEWQSRPPARRLLENFCHLLTPML